MATELKPVFIIGYFLSLTPLYTEPKASLLRKCYGFLVLLLISTGMTISTVNRRFYQNFVGIKIVEHIIMDVNLLIFNICAVLIGVFWKAQEWQKFLDNLKNVTDVQISSNVLTFYVFNILGLLTFIFTYCIRYEQNGGLDYVRRYNVVYLQDYMVFFYNTFLYLIGSILFLKYKQISTVMENLDTTGQSSALSRQYSLKKLEMSLCFLKDCVDIFNELFGWPIFFIISFTSLHILNHFDNIFAASASSHHSYNFSKKVTADVAILILACVRFGFYDFIIVHMYRFQGGTIAMIFKCDFVVKEAEKILLLSYKLKRNYCTENTPKIDFQKFCTSVEENLPRFSAARFFHINRCTVLHIFGTVTSFFIVMIQLRHSSY